MAEALTLLPGAASPEQIAKVRATGLDDRAIHDACQAIAYFNYINRIASGLGIPLEPEWGRDSE